MGAVASISGLQLAYGDGAARNVVLENLTLDIADGEFVAIAGASGVGKSTLLRVLAGLSAPSAGRVALHAAAAPDRLATALVFQEARLLPWRRVRDNVGFGLEALRLGRAERAARIEEALALVGLADLGARWPWQLSGGQRQRVGLARALAVRPALLLMDEPFGALDAITRAAMQDELLRVWRGSGVSVLFVTHDIDEAVYLADRVVVLNGRPARVTRDIRIARPRPRSRADLPASVEATFIRSGLAERFVDGGGI